MYIPILYIINIYKSTKIGTFNIVLSMLRGSKAFVNYLLYHIHMFIWSIISFRISYYTLFSLIIKVGSEFWSRFITVIRILNKITHVYHLEKRKLKRKWPEFRSQFLRWNLCKPQHISISISCFFYKYEYTLTSIISIIRKFGWINGEKK